MNGGILKREIKIPLINPANPPDRMPPRIPRGIGRFQLTMNTPVITAEKVSTVPTERSMPAVIMMKVTPNARTPLTAVANKIPTKLSKVRKYGEANEKPTAITIKALNAIILWMASERNMVLADTLLFFMVSYSR